MGRPHRPHLPHAAARHGHRRGHRGRPPAAHDRRRRRRQVHEGARPEAAAGWCRTCSCSSAGSTPDKVLLRISQHGGDVIHSSLSPARRGHAAGGAARADDRLSETAAWVSGGLVAALRLDRDLVADQLGQRRGHRRAADARLLGHVAGGLGLVLDRGKDEPAVLAARGALAVRRPARRGVRRPSRRRRRASGGPPSRGSIASSRAIAVRPCSASSASGAICASSSAKRRFQASTATLIIDIAYLARCVSIDDVVCAATLSLICTITPACSASRRTTIAAEPFSGE